MRVFEALTILVTAAGVLRFVQGSFLAWQSWVPALPLVLTTLLVLHLGLEGWRQQMVPAYVAAIEVVALAIIYSDPVPAILPRLLGGGAGAVLLGVAVLLCVARPVISTPVPSGPWRVGTKTIPLGSGVGTRRQEFRIWYPTDANAKGQPARYLTEDWTGRRFERLGLTQSIDNAPPAIGVGKLPILVFLPAWGGPPSQDTVLLQDVASHGYLVAAPDVWNPAAYPDDGRAAADLHTPLVFNTESAAILSREAGLRNTLRQARLARLALDQLVTLNAQGPDPRFAGRLDTDKVGIFGFSFGGSVAVHAALEDARFRAVANLDGWVFTDAYLRGFPQPYLLLSMPPQTQADLHSPDPEIRGQAAMTLEDEAQLHTFLEAHGGTRVIISDIGHDDFRDTSLLFPMRRNAVIGHIGASRARKLVDDFLLAFFDTHVRQAPAPRPAQIALAYPSVRLSTW